jgi:hypothetical protein
VRGAAAVADAVSGVCNLKVGVSALLSETTWAI